MTQATLSKAAQARADRDYAREQLLTHHVSENTRVYTILRHVSSNGMSRDISLIVADSDGRVSDITYYAAAAMGGRLIERNGHRAIRVHGAGMDMGFHLIYNLLSVLFHGHERAGYVLKQEWI